MELEKKRYTQKEVALIFEAYKKEYEKRFSEMRARIDQLIKENERLKGELGSASSNEELILAVLRRAEQTAMDLEKQSQIEYELEFERLKKFSEKWNAYFEKLKAKYPTSKTVKKVIKIKEKVNSKDKSKSPKQVVKELDELIGQDNKGNSTFDPKKKIGDYIAATSSSGFSMDEVLNPGELKLEDICKELGLIDGNE